jgi:hypothetical protein
MPQILNYAFAQGNQHEKGYQSPAGGTTDPPNKEK